MRNFLQFSRLYQTRTKHLDILNTIFVNISLHHLMFRACNLSFDNFSMLQSFSDYAQDNMYNCAMHVCMSSRKFWIHSFKLFLKHIWTVHSHWSSRKKYRLLMGFLLSTADRKVGLHKFRHFHLGTCIKCDSSTLEVASKWP